MGDKDRLSKLHAFLSEKLLSGLISEETRSLAWESCMALREKTGARVPNVGIGFDRGVLFFWNEEYRHLELEFIPGKGRYFFFLENGADRAWCNEWIDDLPEPAVECLKMFPDKDGQC